MNEKMHISQLHKPSQNLSPFLSPPLRINNDQWVSSTSSSVCSVLKPRQEAAHFKLLITLSVTPTVAFCAFFFISHPVRRNLQPLTKLQQLKWNRTSSLCRACVSGLFVAAQSSPEHLEVFSFRYTPSRMQNILSLACTRAIGNALNSQWQCIDWDMSCNLRSLFLHCQCFGRIILPDMNSQWFYSRVFVKWITINISPERFSVCVALFCLNGFFETSENYLCSATQPL